LAGAVQVLKVSFAMKFLRKRGGIVLVWFLLSAGVCEGGPVLTTLEESRYTQLTSSAEVSAFLAQLSEQYPFAQKVTIATSALGDPIDALLVASDMSWFRNEDTTDYKMTVMLVGSQHGMEPSGAEALLLVARDLVTGDLRPYLEEMNIILIPNSNPDGRNRNRRVNGNGVNLSTNFIILSEPESRGIMDALHRWEPEVLLDVHESAVLKKKSLGRQGYLTDFEAQFEAANNPNVDSRIRSFSFERLLPEVIELVKTRGLPAQRYIGEITSIHQPITHGGLSLRNLRNMGGMLGSFSFLLENRLDPASGIYPTPRNIRARVSKQDLCIRAFLECCHKHRLKIMSLCRDARMRWRNPRDQEPLYLSFTHASAPNRPYITLPLRRIDTGAIIQHTFRYCGSVEYHSPLALTSAYIITAHQDLIREILDRHHIQCDTLGHDTEDLAEVQHDSNRQGMTANAEGHRSTCPITQPLENRIFHPGDLRISLRQPACRLIPLLLDLQSACTMFNSREYEHLVKNQQAPFVFRIPGSPLKIPAVSIRELSHCAESVRLTCRP
jgi:hypothetical protein